MRCNKNRYRWWMKKMFMGTLLLIFPVMGFALTSNNPSNAFQDEVMFRVDTDGNLEFTTPYTSAWYNVSNMEWQDDYGNDYALRRGGNFVDRVRRTLMEDDSRAEQRLRTLLNIDPDLYDEDDIPEQVTSLVPRQLAYAPEPDPGINVAPPYSIANTNQLNTWQDARGYYYQLGSNGELWIAMDGYNWKKSATDRWRGSDGYWYRIENGRALRSQDNQRWKVAPNNSWMSQNNQVFTYSPSQGVYLNTSRGTFLPQINNRNSLTRVSNVNWIPMDEMIWQTEYGVYYMLDEQGDLWRSRDGQEWTQASDNMWIGPEGRYFKFDQYMNLWVSDEGRRWDQYDGDLSWDTNEIEYLFTPDNGMFYRILES